MLQSEHEDVMKCEQHQYLYPKMQITGDQIVYPWWGQQSHSIPFLWWPTLSLGSHFRSKPGSN